MIQVFVLTIQRYVRKRLIHWPWKIVRLIPIMSLASGSFSSLWRYYHQHIWSCRCANQSRHEICSASEDRCASCTSARKFVFLLMCSRSNRVDVNLIQVLVSDARLTISGRDCGARYYSPSWCFWYTVHLSSFTDPWTVCQARQGCSDRACLEKNETVRWRTKFWAV